MRRTTDEEFYLAVSFGKVSSDQDSGDLFFWQVTQLVAQSGWRIGSPIYYVAPVWSAVLRRTTDEEFYLAVSFGKVSSDQDSGDLFFWQVTQPDIDAVAVTRGRASEISIV